MSEGLKAAVNKLVNSGTVTKDDGDKLVAAGAGNLKAKAGELLAAGKLTKAQHDDLIAQGGGN